MQHSHGRRRLRCEQRCELQPGEGTRRTPCWLLCVCITGRIASSVRIWCCREVSPAHCHSIYGAVMPQGVGLHMSLSQRGSSMQTHGHMCPYRQMAPVWKPAATPGPLLLRPSSLHDCCSSQTLWSHGKHCKPPDDGLCLMLQAVSSALQLWDITLSSAAPPPPPPTTAPALQNGLYHIINTGR